MSIQIVRQTDCRYVNCVKYKNVPENRFRETNDIEVAHICIMLLKYLEP